MKGEQENEKEKKPSSSPSNYRKRINIIFPNGMWPVHLDDDDHDVYSYDMLKS